MQYFVESNLKKMKYFKTEDKLIQLNLSTNVYRVKNSIEKVNKTITKDEFELLNAIQINKQRFHELMNDFFRNIKHEWEHEHSFFKKLDNFDKYGNSSSMSWADIPSHKLEGYLNTELKIVYHWGRVYYIVYFENYSPQAQLIDIYKLQKVRWVCIKNVAPIMNISKNKIV